MCAQGKTAIVSRSHFYVLLMMMIECESVLQQMCTVSYNHTRKILPFVRLDAAFFLDRKSPFYADFSGNAM